MSEDLEETRMSIGEHLEEMRSHLIRALLWLSLITFICLQFQEQILELATWPHRKTMLAIVESNQYDKVRDVLPSDELDAVQSVIKRKESLAIAHEDLLRNSELLKRKFADLGAEDLQKLNERQQKIIDEITALNEKQQSLLGESKNDLVKFTELQKEVLEKSKEFTKVQDETLQAERLIDRRSRRANVKVRLQQLSYPEAFMGYLKVSFVLALFIAGPFMGREAWKFVAKGLYPEEKRWVTVISPLSFIAFICGAMFGYFILIPLGLHYLATYGGEDIIEGSITLSEYLSIFITLTLVVGLFYQLPLIMSFTTLIHITTDQIFREKRRWFYFGAVIVSAFLTPPDPVTQVLMWIPLIILYELGIWLSFAIVRSRAKDTDVPPSDDPTSPPDDPSGPVDQGPKPDESPNPETDSATPSEEAKPEEEVSNEDDPKEDDPKEEATPSESAPESASKDSEQKEPESAEDAEQKDESVNDPSESDSSESNSSETQGEEAKDDNWEDEVYPDEWYEQLDEDEEYLDTETEPSLAPENLIDETPAPDPEPSQEPQAESGPSEDVPKDQGSVNEAQSESSPKTEELPKESDTKKSESKDYQDPDTSTPILTDD